MNYELAFQQYQNENYQDAITSFQSLLKTNTTEYNVACCFYLAKCFRHLQDDANRMYYLIRALSYDNNYPEIYCEIGYYYMERQDYLKAITCFESALSSTNRSIHRFYDEGSWGYIPALMLCLCYDKQKNIRKADYYNELAALYQPDSPSVSHNREYFSQVKYHNGDAAINQIKNSVLFERDKYLNYPVNDVSLLTITNKAKYLETIFDNYRRMDYPSKELILVLNNNELVIDSYQKKAHNDPSIHIYQLDESVTLGECLNFAVSKSSYDYIAKVDDDDFYGKYYLTDQMNCFYLPDVSIVTKSIRFIHFEDDDSLFLFHGHGENTEVMGGGGGTIVTKKSVFDQIRFHDINCGEDDHFFLDAAKLGLKIYASNRFNYVYERHINPKDHTFVMSDLTFKNNSDEIVSDYDYRIVTSV